jgi:hypothetical protein
MFDGLLFKILYKVENTCEGLREWLIKRSLPNPCKSANAWVDNYKKWKKSRINKNDTE